MTDFEKVAAMKDGRKYPWKELARLLEIDIDDDSTREEKTVAYIEFYQRVYQVRKEQEKSPNYPRRILSVGRGFWQNMRADEPTRVNTKGEIRRGLVERIIADLIKRQRNSWTTWDARSTALQLIDGACLKNELKALDFCIDMMGNIIAHKLQENKKLRTIAAAVDVKLLEWNPVV